MRRSLLWRRLRPADLRGIIREFHEFIRITAPLSQATLYPVLGVSC
jgi:hypothetical protein